MTPKIELQKTRDFGEIITDTFIFVRQNLKPLLLCFFVFSGFFLIAGTITSAMQQVKTFSFINDSFDPVRSNQFFGSSNPFARMLGLEYILSIVFLWLNYVAITVTVYSYICIYREKGNVAATPSEVWGYFKYFFFKIFGSSFLLGLLLIIAFVLCIIPGVWLYPIFGLIFPIMVFENTSLGYAFNKSFKLIKDNWWLTFGCLFVIGLIVYFATVIVVLPTTLLNLGSLFIHPSKGVHLSVTLSIITVFLQHLCQVFYILPIVTMSLCYFNLSEHTDGTGLLGRINQLGNIIPDDTTQPEEY